MTVLYTTHYLEEAQELSDRVGIMDHGELIALGTQAELTRQVGEHQTLLLSVGETDDAAGLCAAARTVQGVLRADLSGRAIAIAAHRADEVLAPIVALAAGTGARIRSVDIQEPNLESVFLSLTGRALRD
jgi:ABC-2 type transport system ATP-binding protein